MEEKKENNISTNETMKPDSYNIVPPGEEGDE